MGKYIIGALIVTGFLILGYSALRKSNPIPKAFFTTYKENEVLAKDIVRQSTFDFEALGIAVKEKDLPQASRLVTEALEKNTTNTERLQTLLAKTATLQRMGEAVSDITYQQRVLEFVALLEDRNGRLSHLLPIQKELFTALKNYYNSLLSGENNVQLAGNVDRVVQTIQTSTRELGKTESQIDATYEGLLKEINFDTIVLPTNLPVSPNPQ